VITQCRAGAASRPGPAGVSQGIILLFRSSRSEAGPTANGQIALGPALPDQQRSRQVDLHVREPYDTVTPRSPARLQPQQRRGEHHEIPPVEDREHDRALGARAKTPSWRLRSCSATRPRRRRPRPQPPHRTAPGHASADNQPHVPTRPTDASIVPRGHDERATTRSCSHQDAPARSGRRRPTPLKRCEQFEREHRPVQRRCAQDRRKRRPRRSSLSPWTVNLVVPVKSLFSATCCPSLTPTRVVPSTAPLRRRDDLA